MNVPALPDLLSAQMAVYRGRDVVEQSVARTTVNLVDDGGEFPDAVDRGEAAGRPPVPWVRVPKAALTRRYRRVVTAMWDGERVEIVARRSGVAHFLYDQSQQWAEQHALAGSRYEGGWRGQAPVDELSDIRITEYEAPTGGQEDSP